MNDGTAGPIFIRSAMAGELREERERSRIENSVGVSKDEASSEYMPGELGRRLTEGSFQYPRLGR